MALPLRENRDLYLEVAHRILTQQTSPFVTFFIMVQNVV